MEPNISIKFPAGYRVTSKRAFSSNILGMFDYEFSLSVLILNEETDLKEIKNLLDTWIKDQWKGKFIVDLHDTDISQMFRRLNMESKIYYLNGDPGLKGMLNWFIKTVAPNLFKGKDIKILKLILEVDQIYEEVVKLDWVSNKIIKGELKDG